MDALNATTLHVAAIYSAGWWLRHYRRGRRMQRTSAQARLREQAIQRLGLTVREAFNASDDFEPLLVAVFNSLNPAGDDPPF
jgi:hypothetical protein